MKNKIVSIWSFLVKSHGKEVLLWEWIVYFFCLFLGFWMTYFLAQPESMGGFMNFGNLFHLLFLMVLPIQLIPEFFQEHFSYFFVPDFGFYFFPNLSEAASINVKYRSSDRKRPQYCSHRFVSFSSPGPLRKGANRSISLLRQDAVRRSAL